MSTGSGSGKTVDRLVDDFISDNPDLAAVERETILVRAEVGFLIGVLHGQVGPEGFMRLADALRPHLTSQVSREVLDAELVRAAATTRRASS